MTDTFADGLLGRTAHSISAGTATAWIRLIEELSKVRAGKVLITMDGHAPQSVCRLASAQRLTENVKREVER